MVSGENNGAVAEVDEWPLPKRVLVTRDQLTQLQHLGRLAGIDHRGTYRFDTVLECRVEPRKAELPVWSVIGEDRDGEHVETIELVHQPGDIGDVVRGRPAGDSGHRIDNVGRRAGRGDDGKLPGECHVVLGIPAPQCDGRRDLHPVMLDDRRRDLHQLGIIVDCCAMLGEAMASLFVANDETNLFEDLE